MNADRRRAFVALTAAGVLWGTTVPLSKLALGWLPPGWLTLARFSIAAAILMPAARGRLRRACRPAVLASGALGYGGAVIVQNAGITPTSVSPAAPFPCWSPSSPRCGTGPLPARWRGPASRSRSLVLA